MEGVTSASESHTLPLPPCRRRPQVRCPTILPFMASFTNGLVFTPVGGVVRSRKRGVGITRPFIHVSCTLPMSIPIVVVRVSQCFERRIPQTEAYTIVDHHIEPSYFIFPLPSIDLPRNLLKELPRNFELPSARGDTRFTRDETRMDLSEDLS